jgi:hypothetical protein
MDADGRTSFLVGCVFTSTCALGIRSWRKRKGLSAFGSSVAYTCVIPESQLPQYGLAAPSVASVPSAVSEGATLQIRPSG